jgi:hypothetical protein
MTAPVLDLAAGSALVLDGAEWAVEQLQPQYGTVVLTRGDGQRMRVSVRFLISHPHCRPSTRSAAAAADRGRQPKTVQDLSPHQRELAHLRLEHLLEAETGFRSGDPSRPQPGEPKPEYDPATTTLTQRRHAKVAELRALDADQARLLGLDRAGYRTLIRWDIARRSLGVMGCTDDRWLRPRGGHPRVTEEVREAIIAVRQETLHRSRISMRARVVLIRQFVRETYGPEVAVPCAETLRLVWREWFGPGGARQRYARSAAPAGSGQHVIVTRPGQVVALDTTILPVKVREGVFGEPVSVHLTLALDAYTHSLVAFRLTMVSDSSVDVAMLLRDMMMPLPLREDWGEGLEWPYPGIPAAVVSEFAGYKVAGLPFFAPETITTDHGSVYKNHHLVEVQRVIGANILPARVLRPTDKQACERTFGGIRSLLFEYLLGYTGVDVADRGADPEADAVLTIDEMEHLIAAWIVAVWQNRRLGEHAPCWDPAGDHSPNTLFAAAMGQGGFAMQIPLPELFYQLLPAHFVKIHGQRGVKVRGLWYDGPALDAYRDEPSRRGGRYPGRWVVHRDPRDARTVFFQDPVTHVWHALPWTGMPPDGQVPAFGDARVRDLLKKAEACGLKPKSDAELLPVLLELIGSKIPVSQWPTQMTKAQRTEHAREVTQAQAARDDRPASPSGAAGATPDTRADQANVTPLRRTPGWPQRASQTHDSIDAERRRRREAAVPVTPKPPPRLGASFREHNVFLLPDADEEDGGPAPR